MRVRQSELAMDHADRVESYKPDIPWRMYDFLINRTYWEYVGVKKAYSIRLNNLRDISRVLYANNVAFWLYGKTLLGAVKEGKLLDDHDDDIGIMLSDRQFLMSTIRPQLEAKGFVLIRDAAGIVSFVRDFRYVDVCLFGPKSFGQLGYGDKSAPKKFFLELDEVLLEDEPFPIPLNSNALLRREYSQNPIRRLLRTLIGLSSAKKNVRRIKKIPAKIKEKHMAAVENNKFGLGRILERLSFLSGFSVRPLTESEFLALHIEPQDSFNWNWRHRHLGLVTDFCRLSLVGDLVAHLSESEVRETIEMSVVESDTSIEFHAKNNLDLRFWWSGNNYFWYCVKYQFRSDVVSYVNANAYISKGIGPLLYSAEYYENLDPLSDDEIAALFRGCPIVVENGCVASGKHRIFAMVGRLASHKPYIPIKAISS